MLSGKVKLYYMFSSWEICTWNLDLEVGLLLQNTGNLEKWKARFAAERQVGGDTQSWWYLMRFCLAAVCGMREVLSRRTFPPQRAQALSCQIRGSSGVSAFIIFFLLDESLRHSGVGEASFVFWDKAYRITLTKSSYKEGTFKLKSSLVVVNC